MDRLCLILPCNLYIVPYFKTYEKMLNELGIQYDILMWNRTGVEENCSGRIEAFNCLDKANDRNPLKVVKYFRFYRFCKRRIILNRYTKIVFLDTSSCTLVFMTNFLKKQYYRKYWVDIRDYTFENNRIYKKLLQNALDAAYCCDISSKGFLDFLPPMKNYCVTHNIDVENINKISQIKKTNSDKIRISFIGNVRYFEINRQLVEIFKHDERFQLQFYGTGSDDLMSYCLKNNIKNVDFMGRFPYEETPYLYAKTDIINNLYGNSSMEVKTALSNKLYYSIYLNIPIIVSPNTFMSKIVEEFKIGYVIDLESNNIPERLYRWYMENKKNNNDKREILKKNIEYEFRLYQDTFKKFLSAT